MRPRAAAVLCLLLASCASNVELRFDVHSDLEVGAEFDEVAITVDGVRSTYPGEGDFLSGFRSPARVITPGPITADVALTRRGLPVLRRRIELTVRESALIPIWLLLACRDRTCPGPGDDASASECDGGRCVAPACSEQHPELCPPDPACQTDPDCGPASVSCRSHACVEGRCVSRVVAGACSAGEYCDATLGCTPREASDAGTADAGADAGACGIWNGAPTVVARRFGTSGADALGGLALRSEGLLLAMSFDGSGSLNGADVATTGEVDSVIFNASETPARIVELLTGPNAQRITDLSAASDGLVFAGVFEGASQRGSTALTGSGAGAFFVSPRSTLVETSAAHVEALLRSSSPTAECLASARPSVTGTEATVACPAQPMPLLRFDLTGADDHVHAIEPDGLGGAYVGGSFTGSFELPDGTIVPAVGRQDAFVMHLRADGTLGWFVPFGGVNTDPRFGSAVWALALSADRLWAVGQVVAVEGGALGLGPLRSYRGDEDAFFVGIDPVTGARSDPLLHHAGLHDRFLAVAPDGCDRWVIGGADGDATENGAAPYVAGFQRGVAGMQWFVSSSSGTGAIERVAVATDGTIHAAGTVLGSVAIAGAPIGVPAGASDIVVLTIQP